MGGSVGRWVAKREMGGYVRRWVLNREICGYVGLFHFTIWHLGKPSAFPPSKPIPTKPIGKLKAFVLF